MHSRDVGLLGFEELEGNFGRCCSVWIYGAPSNRTVNMIVHNRKCTVNRINNRLELIAQH